MNLQLIHYRMHLRQTLKKATLEQLKITREEVLREMQQRNKQRPSRWIQRTPGNRNLAKNDRSKIK